MGLEKELEFAKQLGRDVAAEILTLTKAGCTVEIKPDGSCVTNIDTHANAMITEALRSSFPLDAILSEETADDRSRLDKERVWIIDPIDGTVELILYSNNCAAGGDPTLYHNFAVHIGMAYQHRAVLGVVACPTTGELVYATRNRGAFLEKDGLTQRVYRRDSPTLERAKVGVNPSNRERNTAVVVELGIKEENIVSMSSVGVKICAIARGKIDCYVSVSGKTSEWDLCAPHVIAEESGLLVTDRYTTPITYNRSYLTRESVFVAPLALHAALIQGYRTRGRG